MATEVERLVARVEADLTGLKAGLTKAGALTDKTAKSMGVSLAGIAGPVGVAEKAMKTFGLVVGALAVRELAGATRSSLAFADSIKDTATQTGFGVAALQELRYAAVQAGLSQDSLDGALSKLNVNLGKARLEGGAAAKTFRQIGVDASSVGNGEAALNAVIDGLRKIQDPATRAAASFEIFGKEAGPKFQELIDGGSDGLNRLREAARNAGAVLDEELVANASAANDQLEAMDMVLKAQTTQTLVNLSGVLITAAGAMAGFSKMVHEATEGLGIFFAKMVAGSDQAFENKIEDARDQLQGLKSDLDDLVARQEGAGAKGSIMYGLIAPSDEEVAAMREKVKAAEAELKRLQDLQRGVSGMKPSSAPAAKPSRVKLPDDVIRQQRELLRQLDDESIKSGQRLAGDMVARFGDLTSGIRVNYEAASSFQRNFFADEEALEKSRYEAQLDAFRKQSGDLQMSAADRAVALKDIETTHAANMLGIQRDGQDEAEKLRQKHLDETLYRYEENIGIQRGLAQQLEKFEKLTAEQRYDTAIGLAGGLLSALGPISKKTFKLSKDVALAEAVVNTYRAATAAFANSGGNVVVGAAKAAVALAFGFAQVRAIQSQQFGGSGAGGGGGAVASASAASTGVEDNAGGNNGAPAVRTINIAGINPGDLYSGRQLLEVLNMALADGGQLKAV